MASFVFSSHDGFGLGHVRRNVLLAEALLDQRPDAHVTIVTGTDVRPRWAIDRRIRVVHVPPLLKDADGAYRNPGMSFDLALQVRARVFRRVVEEVQPAAIVVDRHPYGTAGELREGLLIGRENGARLYLGLRDILDEADQVRIEIDGDGWAGVPELFDRALVYGEPSLCEHEREYGLPLPATYCGWVVGRSATAPVDRNLIAIAAGGGGDGGEVYRLGLELLRRLPDHHGVLLTGPYADDVEVSPSVARRVRVARNSRSVQAWLARAGATVQMAGYNTTAEALAAGLRPMLVPRRSPRREQAIRAQRLAALGLADVVDAGAEAGEVAWLLTRPRRLHREALRDAGIRLDGAYRAMSHLPLERRRVAS